MRKSAEVISERKFSLARKYEFRLTFGCKEYMNILANSINIFEDKDVVEFLKLDFESIHVKALAKALAKNLELLEKISVSRSSSSRQDTSMSKGHSNLQILMPDFHLSKLFSRKRGISHDDELISAKSANLTLVSPQFREEKWSEMTFENEEERISKFIDILNNDPDNQSQLVSDFQDYFFGSKPILKVDTLKRLFLGQMKKEGLFAHLQKCH